MVGIIKQITGQHQGFSICGPKTTQPESARGGGHVGVLVKNENPLELSLDLLNTESLRVGP